MWPRWPTGRLRLISSLRRLNTFIPAWIRIWKPSKRPGRKPGSIRHSPVDEAAGGVPGGDREGTGAPGGAFPWETEWGDRTVVVPALGAIAVARETATDVVRRNTSWTSALNLWETTALSVYIFIFIFSVVKQNKICSSISPYWKRADLGSDCGPFESSTLYSLMSCCCFL